MGLVFCTLFGGASNPGIFHTKYLPQLMFGQKGRTRLRAPFELQNDTRMALPYRNQAYVQCTACVVECPY